MYGIKNNLLDFVKKDYKDRLPQFDFSLDCSFGTNPWGSWPGLGEMGDLLQHIDGYPPEDGELKERIIQHFADAGKLTPEMISLTLGSIGGIMTLDRMFLYPGKPVIGVAPSSQRRLTISGSMEPTIPRFICREAMAIICRSRI